MSLGSGITISTIVPHKIGPESLTLTAGLYHLFIPTLTTCDWKFVLNSTNQNAAGVAPVQMFKLRKGSAELSPTASVKDRVEHALAERSGHRFLDPSVAVHRARPSFFRAFREPLRALLDGGANGRKFSSGGAKGCDEMQNLFEEDGAIEIAVQHAEIAKFPIMRIVI
jgi:hypothetical protein